MVTLDIDGLDIQIRFPFSAEQVERVKTITSDWRKRGGCWVASATRLDEIYSVFPDAKASDKLRDWIELQRRMQEFKSGAINGNLYWAPASLLPHQKSALAFLSGFKRAALLDPPGSGKSRTAVAWAAQALPALIVCPSAVKYHWKREIEACYPNAVTCIIQGRPRPSDKLSPYAQFTVERGPVWWIINYDVLKNWMEFLPPFKTLICDEHHYCKNMKSKRGDAVLQLAERIPNALFLTGSPALNRPAELESMLVALGYLKPRERFAWRVRFTDGKRIIINEKGVKYQHRDPIYRWDFSGAANVELLARELDTFSVRRPFAELSTSLPPVTHTLMEIDLPDLKPHEAMWKQMRQQIKSNDPQARGEALGLLGKMISWCAAAKHDIIRDLVVERLDAGESPVVFCDFLEPLDNLRAELGMRAIMLDGRMTMKVREEAIKLFQESPEPTALLASRRACGVGMDGLQHKSRTVIYMNLCWTPEGHRQSWARVAREGQRQPVEVITTLARGTVEEAVLSIVYHKAQVTDIICSSPSLSEETRADWARALSLVGGV